LRLQKLYASTPKLIKSYVASDTNGSLFGDPNKKSVLGSGCGAQVNASEAFRAEFVTVGALNEGLRRTPENTKGGHVGLFAGHRRDRAFFAFRV
jgi:hypothetical protein